jgi:hypothetical protein
VPKKEYNLWFPELISPFSVLTLSQKKNKCFEMLLSPKHDFSKFPTEVNHLSEGLKVSLYGQTPFTEVLLILMNNCSEI